MNKPLCLTLMFLVFCASSQAQTFTMIHKFKLQAPTGELAMDANGVLYGTAAEGGRYNLGIVFKLTKQPDLTWKMAVIHSFGSVKDGYTPGSGLTIAPDGTIYGQTSGDGAGNGVVIFRMAFLNGKWGYKILAKPQAVVPAGPVSIDSAGALYGSMMQGGVCAGYIYKLAAGKFAHLYDFKCDGLDGQIPQGGVTVAQDGTVYGTTYFGGTSSLGTVYKIAQDGTETVIHSFAGLDGQFPMAAPIVSQSGLLLGTTANGGTDSMGTVYSIAPDGTETVLYDFHGGSDGQGPQSSLVEDAQGNLYGTTYNGGQGKGLVFEFNPNETILHIFPRFWSQPAGGVMLDAQGVVYGLTSTRNAGTAFQIVQ